MLLTSPLQRPVRLAVLISGGGTTLMNFVEQIEGGQLSAQIPLVVASRADCGGIARARAKGLRCEVLPRKAYSSVEEFSSAIFELCREVQADLVTMAGFLSLIRIPDDFQDRVLNIHPALIPAFCGRGYHGQHVHEAVIASGVKISGCTVHFADNEYDHGAIIGQTCVPVLDDDTPDTLAARVFAEECELYPEAIRLLAAGRVEIIEGRTRVKQ